MFIHCSGWATKSDGFFSLLFNLIHATFCLPVLQLIDSLFCFVFHDQLSWSPVFLFSWQFRIHCMSHYKSRFALPIWIRYTIMGAKWFCLSCFRRDLISSASCVDSRKSSYNSPILRLDAKSEKSIVGVVIQYLLSILRLFQFSSSVLEFRLRFTDSPIKCCVMVCWHAKRDKLYSPEVSSVACLRLVQERDIFFLT